MSWFIKREETSSNEVDNFMEFLTLGTVKAPTEYVIENDDGDTKRVLAYNKDQLDESISKGNMRDG